MLWVDTGRAVRAIDALPYVRAVQVHREWPDTVEISVAERTPVAWVAGASGAALVDRTGRVLETVGQAVGLPQLLGAATVASPGARIDALGAARVAGALSGIARAGTASVEETDHGIVLHLAAGPDVRMGPATQIGVKLRAALAAGRVERHAGRLRRCQRADQPGRRLRVGLTVRRPAPGCVGWGS
jgi:cell division protein FtsQ